MSVIEKSEQRDVPDRELSLFFLLYNGHTSADSPRHGLIFEVGALNHLLPRY